jgi:hypothetical protein
VAQALLLVMRYEEPVLFVFEARLNVIRTGRISQ